ncbi:MAG: AraC family transcriptional regulator [Oscillospiraceae bacterium]|nr:AraC family transcriptional regulator [Oscillospiraceae bacterium]
MALDAEVLAQRVSELEAQLLQLQQERERYLADRAVIALMSYGDNQKLDRDSFAEITGVRFHGNRFVLCGFTDNYTPPGSLDEVPIWRSLNSPFYYQLSDLIRPAFREQHACLTANGSGCIYCLVNLSDSLAPEALQDTFTQICRSINDQLEQTEGFRFQVLVSPIGYGLTSIPELRRNVEMLREYWNIVGSAAPEILFYHDVANSTPQSRDLDTARKANEQFSDYINRGDFQKARDYFRGHILKELIETLPSVTMLRFRVAAMIDYMTQTLTRASQELGIEQVLEQLHAEELLLTAQTLEDIADQMDVILDALAERWQSAGSANQQLARRARACVDENYGDCDLNVNFVAEQLGISASHLTRVFQSCYHIRMLDYIQQVRLRAAKALLGTDMTIREIAEQTGYGSQINLIRAFKRIEGKTPSEFLRKHS